MPKDFHTEEALDAPWTTEEIQTAMAKDCDYFNSFQEYYLQMAAEHR